MQANCKFFIPMDFVCMKKIYGNEWMSPLVDLSVLELVCSISCVSFTHNEGLRDLWNL